MRMSRVSLGDFTSVTLLSVDRSTSAGFAETPFCLHRDMVDDLQHRAYSAIDVMRQMNAPVEGRRHLMPVVFTSRSGISRRPREPAPTTRWAMSYTPSPGPSGLDRSAGDRA